ncbi:MAG: AmmeMemoRadiSam system protein A [Treponema sp.]|jgi:AmmeMemoRadiSam system protein A|nr:AmmeMemoRadiSam system protein A [Treponema sp.]
MNLIITAEEKEVLLRDARESIAATLENRLPKYHREAALKDAVRLGTSALVKPCGAFVTLHKMGNLRGCIGRMSSPDMLEKTVQIMALEAAFGDPRFPPLTGDELPLCDIEISVLSPMRPCPDPQSVKVGVHGLCLSCRGRSGVLLPQVPIEQGWDRETFLKHICLKAGLPAGAYAEPDARLFIFTAVVFGEKS